jgi:ATP-dependent DNA ligase
MQRIALRDMYAVNLSKLNCIKIVPTHSFCTKEDINKMLQYYLDLGYEGIILRHPVAKYHPCRTNFLLKLKPRNKASYSIIKPFEAISIDGYMKDTLGGVLLRNGEGKFFHCGAGCLTHVERQFLWDSYKRDNTCLTDKLAYIYYQELSKNGIPQQPILRYIEGL